MLYDRSNYINQPVSIEKELNFLFNTDETITIFEIGACEGEDSVKYARLFPNATIYAFEPLPNNVKLIDNNFREYGLKNASYYNLALSSENGTATFYVSSGSPADAENSDWDYGNKSSSLLPPAKHLETANFIHFDDKIEVETMTLKSFCSAKKIKQIDFIHMDVQGAELMVLEGAEDFISSIKAIWLEVSKVDLYKDQPLVDDVKKFMEDNNFVLIKDSLIGIQGDQLYISKQFYSKFTILYIRCSIKVKYVFMRLKQKIGG